MDYPTTDFNPDNSRGITEQDEKADSSSALLRESLQAIDTPARFPVKDASLAAADQLRYQVDKDGNLGRTQSERDYLKIFLSAALQEQGNLNKVVRDTNGQLRSGFVRNNPDHSSPTYKDEITLYSRDGRYIDSMRVEFTLQR